jgi:hypothetical protein
MRALNGGKSIALSLIILVLLGMSLAIAIFSTYALATLEWK